MALFEQHGQQVGVTDVVTGAYGYIGRAITARLLETGRSVKTVTTHPDKPDPFGGAVPSAPLDFERLDRLEADLRGAATLYNTYWIRFEYGGATFRQAVRETAALFACARRAGVRKIVHISVTQASTASRLPYYRGKALQEEALKASGVPFAIVRPTLVFGPGDILVNNMAWLIRRFPIFPIFGSGEYRLQPVFLADVAQIAVDAGGRADSTIEDAAGPEAFSFEDFIRLLAERVHPGRRLAHVPPWLGLAVGRIVGEAIGDVILTRDELRGLMDNLLTSNEPARGTTSFTAWLESHSEDLGTSYASELARHFHWRPPSRSRWRRQRSAMPDRKKARGPAMVVPVETDRQLPSDAAELFRRIDREWKALHDAVARHDRARLEVRPGGAWSIKDHLAHVSAWEWYLYRHHLSGQPEHAAMDIDETTYRSLDQDGVNALLYRRNRARPLADVERDLMRSHEEILTCLHEIRFDRLLVPRYPEDPGAGPLLRWVASNTYEHYEEHRVAIERQDWQSAGAGMG